MAKYGSRTQKYHLVVFEDMHIDYDALGSLIENIQYNGGNFSMRKDDDSGAQSYLIGVPVGRKVGRRTLGNGTVGITLKEEDGKVTLGCRGFGEKSEIYRFVREYVLDTVIADGTAKVYTDDMGMRIRVPKELRLWVT